MNAERYIVPIKIVRFSSHHPRVQFYTIGFQHTNTPNIENIFAVRYFYLFLFFSPCTKSSACVRFDWYSFVLIEIIMRTTMEPRDFQDAENDIASILMKLETLKKEIFSNSPFRKLTSDNVDVQIWNKVLDDYSDKNGNRPTFLFTNWLYGECYIHRRIFEAFETRSAR